jgi:dipeptidyl aminopeptidase/acylaminoacyl peptidase
MILLRWLSTLCLAPFCLSTPGFADTGAADAQAAPLIPVAHFAGLPVVENFKLSPDGQYFAALATVKGRPGLVTSSLDGKDRAVLSATEVFVRDFEWANNDRLIVTVRATDGVMGKLVNLERLISVDRKLKETLIFDMEPNNHGCYRQQPHVISMLKHDPEHVLAALDDLPSSWASPEVHKVNIYTGSKRRVQRSIRSIVKWMADEDGNLRLGIAIDKKPGGGRGRTQTVYYRETEEADWEVIQEADYFDDDRLVPVAFEEANPGVLLVSRDSLGADAVADLDEPEVLRFNLAERRITGPGEFPHREAIRAQVAVRFPGRKFDVLSSDTQRDLFTVRVWSDIHPPEHYLYVAQNRAFHLLGREYEQLAPRDMAPMERVTYTARDGLEIPAFLTLPNDAGRKNLPTVVYPHGGPWAHDEWGFDNYVQFLASRGYAVLQPQFRGSTGYGIEHEAAGYGQWGLAIQDDITDGVQWLVDQGIADPGRICIYGASFGGYAAAMGAVRTPALYRCAIAENAVLDLEEFIDDGRYLLFRDINRAVWNPRRDAEDASPYHLRESIEAPLLIIASERDTVVPYKDHSRKLYRKLKRDRHDVDLIVLEGGEHWRTNGAHELTKLMAIEAFLWRNIGKGTAGNVAGD